MSDIVELLRTIGELARAVAAKDAEIEEMKSIFDKQIAVLNSYISQLELHLPHASNDLPATGELDLPVEDFLQTLETFKSAHRNSTATASSDQYILVPTHKLKYLLKRPSQSTPPPKVGIEKANTVLPIKSFFASVSRSGSELHAHSNPRSKRTCSYCNQPGHSRARCIERLAKPARPA